MESYRIKESHCLGCGKAVDAVTSTIGAKGKPNEGDLSVCIYCGKIAKYGAEMNLVPLPDEELLLIKAEHSEVYKVLMRAQVLIQNRIKRN